jgi:hypothetical protein
MNESELNIFYLEGPLSIYKNLPCQRATMTSDMSYATVSLQGVVASFIVMGIELFKVHPSVLQNPATSYFSSKVALSTNQRAADL